MEADQISSFLIGIVDFTKLVLKAQEDIPKHPVRLGHWIRVSSEPKHNDKPVCISITLSRRMSKMISDISCHAIMYWRRLLSTPIVVLYVSCKKKANLYLFWHGSFESCWVADYNSKTAPFHLLSRPKRLRWIIAERYQLPRRTPYPTWCQVAMIFSHQIVIQSLWRQHLSRLVVREFWEKTWMVTIRSIEMLDEGTMHTLEKRIAHTSSTCDLYVSSIKCFCSCNMLKLCAPRNKALSRATPGALKTTHHLDFPNQRTIHPWLPKIGWRVGGGTWSVSRKASSWMHQRQCT